MAKRVLVVNFGSSKGGLSTVGYALYDPDGSVNVARTTDNVTEIGTSTGIYAVEADINEGFNGIVLWDTGEGSPRYAPAELNFSQMNAIQDDTDKIRLIHNYFRVERETYTKLFDKIAGLRKIVTDSTQNLVKPDSIDKLDKKLSKFADRSDLTLDSIGKLFEKSAKKIKIDVNAPQNKEFSTTFTNINKKVDKIDGELGKITNMKLRDEMKSLLTDFRALDSKLSVDLKALSKSLLENIKSDLNKILSDFKILDGKVSENVVSMDEKVSSNMAEITKSKEFKDMSADLIKNSAKITAELNKTQEALDKLKSSIETNANPATFMQGIFGIVKIQEALAELLKKNSNVSAKELNSLLFLGK